MASLDDIIDLTITIESSSVSRAGFGTPLVVDYNTRYSDSLVKSYTRVSGMTDDAFVSTDPAYMAVNKMLSQNPRPRTVKVGRRTTPSAQRMRLTPTTAVSTLYEFTLAVTGGSDQSISFTSSSTANSAEILNALSSAVASASAYGAAGLTASTASGYVQILAPTTGPKFVISEVSDTFSSYVDVTTDTGIADDLTDIELEDDDWYGFMSTSKGKEEIEAAAEWVQARRKFFVAGTMDSDVRASGSSDVGSSLAADSYTRTALFWNDGVHAQTDAAFLGRWLPLTPGSETMKFKTLAGVAADAHTDTQLGYLRAKNVNHYITVGGVDMTAEGKTAEGEYMDVIRFIDWLYANIQEDVFAVLTSNNKIPFTDGGIAQIESVVRAVLQRGVVAGGLASSPAFEVTVPLAADVSAADKASRTLPDVEFSATLAGAIHAVEITGRVSV